MKTYKKLYAQVYNFQNLLKSYYQARRCKSKKKYIIAFEWNLEKNLFDIQEKLKKRLPLLFLSRPSFGIKIKSRDQNKNKQLVLVAKK